MKAKIRQTGEIVDVICYGGSPLTRSDVLDYVNYIDSHGVEHTEQNHLNYFWDFEPIEDTTACNYWQNVRERAAIAAMQGMLSNPSMYLADGDTYPKVAVEYADALIEELKKK
jgi:hypothetical protein